MVSYRLGLSCDSLHALPTAVYQGALALEELSARHEVQMRETIALEHQAVVLAEEKANVDLEETQGKLEEAVRKLEMAQGDLVEARDQLQITQAQLRDHQSVARDALNRVLKLEQDMALASEQV